MLGISLKFNPFKSITLGGAVVAAGTYLWSHLDPSALSPNLAAIVQVVGGLVSVLGLRNAVAKNGASQ